MHIYNASKGCFDEEIEAMTRSQGMRIFCYYIILVAAYMTAGIMLIV